MGCSIKKGDFSRNKSQNIKLIIKLYPNETLIWNMQTKGNEYSMRVTW